MAHSILARSSAEYSSTDQSRPKPADHRRREDMEDVGLRSQTSSPQCQQNVRCLIDWMTVVADVTHELTELIPAVTRERSQVLHIDVSPSAFSRSRRTRKFLIHKTLHIVLVRGPDLPCLVPDCIERSSSNHEILGSPNCEVRIYLQDSILGVFRADLKEIHLPSLRPTPLL